MGDPLPPNLKVIGRYSLLRELRRERHTVSYEAVDPVMNRSLIVKAVQLIKPGGTASASDLEKIEHAFVRQAQAAGRLHHPHIVTVFDAGRSHAYGFLVIERVAGRPLHELLARGLRPAFVQCASIAARICDALAYAHGQAVAHRHLGPQHVFLMADGSPKVAGFGGWIDIGVSGDEALAHTEAMLPYFDSEITPAVRYADGRAAAVLLYMMLTGRAPSAGGATAVHSNTPAPGTRPQPVQWLRADVPAELAALVDTALDPAATTLRTPEALRDALTAFVWTHKTDAVAPATIGMPLAAAPGMPALATLRADDRDIFQGGNAHMMPRPGPADSISGAGRNGSLSAPSMASPSAATLRSPVIAATLAAATQGARGLAPVTSFRVPLRAPPPLHGGAAAEVPALIAPPDTKVPEPVPTPWQIPGLSSQRAQAWQRAFVRHRFSLVAFGVVIISALATGLLLGGLAGRGPKPITVTHTDSSGLQSPAGLSGGQISAPVGTSPAPATTTSPSGSAANASTSAPVAVEGVVHFEIAPWGEVLVDNRPTGVAPPLTRLMLSPGRHLIEIRHPNQPAWTGQIEVDSARPLVIRHIFK